MNLFPTSPSSLTSKRVLVRETIRNSLLNAGYTVIPLAKGTKRPLIRWKKFKTNPPTKQAMKLWLSRFFSADLAILTNDASGIICLDCDKPPYPPKGTYTETPSGGRHYWYKKHKDDKHGINVAPGKDIPWIVKIYAMPYINKGRIPYQSKLQDKPKPNNSTVIIDDTIPWRAYLDNCDFMKWYTIRRNSPYWDGRYPLARAYASNIINSDAPPDIMSLGQNYQHQQTIYDTIYKPITCMNIVTNGYKCSHYDPVTMCCQKDMKSRSPYGLANQKRYDDNAKQD